MGQATCHFAWQMVTTASILDFDLRPIIGEGRTTTCQLMIAVDREVVWPVRGEPTIAVEIQIDDLLAYLTEFWKPLLLRQVYPIAVTPHRPSELRAMAEQRWTEMAPTLVEKEEDLVLAFEEAHDLSTALGGLYDLPHFWMMRAAENMFVESMGVEWLIPFEHVRSSLSRIGEKISEILMDASRLHWSAAVEAWKQRDVSDDAGLLSWSIGVDRAKAKTLIADGSLTAPRDFDDAANDNDELRIAARVAGALPLQQIRMILSIARTFERHDAPKLDRLSRECARYVTERFGRRKPFAQGEAAALFVRDSVQVRDESRVEVFQIVSDLGVRIRSKETEPFTLDGIAIWGRKFGPGVFINEASSRVDPEIPQIEDDLGARVTMAHELCHLLLDGEHALSAVEILDGRMPLSVESRARSFAGEFLLPTQSAETAWLRAGSPRDPMALRELVRQLCDQYGVTWSVASWKLQHGAAKHNIDLEMILNVVAPRR